MAAGLLVRQVGTSGGVALLDVEKQQRVMFCTVPRFQVVDERSWALEHGRDHRLRVVGNGIFIEVFVDDVLVLQFVWYGAPAGRLGLIVDRGAARFTELEAVALGT